MSTPGNQSERIYMPQRGVIPSMGQAISRVTHALDVLNRDVTVNRFVGVEGGRILQRRIAVLTDRGPSGESDFTDNNYWCKFQKVTWSGTNATLVDATAPGIGGIVKAKNLGEVSGHGIDLTASSVYVEVVKTLGSTFPPQAYWSFNYSPPVQQTSVGTLYLTGAYTGGGGGKYAALVLLTGNSGVTGIANLTRNDFGTTNGATVVMAINMLEIDGGANHRIDTSSTNKADLTYPGYFTGDLHAGVTQIWAFRGFPAQLC